MDNLSDQLLDLRMADAVPEKNLMVDTRLNDEDGPNAPSPSESEAAAATTASASTRSGPRFQLKVQKHQVKGSSFCVTPGYIYMGERDTTRGRQTNKWLS